MTRVGISAVAAAFVLLAAAAWEMNHAEANSADRSTSDIIELATGEVVGVSTLTRTDDGMAMTYHTSHAEPGTVATIWWMVFNNPEACENPGHCGPVDFGDPDVGLTVFAATGTVVGGSGQANLAAYLPEGELTVDPDPDANQLHIGDGILRDARDANIFLVLRTHGPMIPELVQHMLSTHDAGCVSAPTEELKGPNTCQDLQLSIHH